MSKEDVVVDLVLSKKAQEILMTIGNNAVVSAVLSKKLLDELINCGALEFDVTFEEVNANTGIKKAMTTWIAMSLSKEVSQSAHFGLGIVSHFDLYFNMGTDPMLNKFLTSIKYDMVANADKVAEMKLKRKNLYALVNRTRTATIDNFELMGTPDKKAEKDKKLAIKTSEDVEKEFNETLQKVVGNNHAENAKRKAISEEVVEVSRAKMPCRTKETLESTDFDTTEMGLLERRKKTLQWVVKVFTEVNAGEVGTACFYDPVHNCGMICPIPHAMHKDMMNNPSTIILPDLMPERLVLPSEMYVVNSDEVDEDFEEE
ncbi:hypothetical protein B484DRAFT_427611 [Ochromonadaceae sp. CCMP2298]|nr:hypothetical protein B484DRAFT_427611 [Ochromonadaceae sp. CCMP2298]